MNGSAVETRDLRRLFGDFVAVDNISLTVSKGEIFGFLGPNGAGKSTTIRMLCGLLLPSSGNGSVGGFDILTEPEEIKKSIGYMSQKFSLYNDLTVTENISFFGGVYGVAGAKMRERADWVFEMAGLTERRDAVTGILPAGIKQRLALGCAILHEPPIIFLDEPTSGVDPVSRRNFWHLIGDMAQSGTTVFVTTHYMDEADYCDRLALIYRGRIIAEGTPGELRRSLKDRDILELRVGRLIEALELLNSSGYDATIFGSGIHVVVPEGEAAMPQIRTLLGEKGITVSDIEKILPSLEDVFVTLIETS